MNLLLKLLYQFGIRNTDYRYTVQGGTLYRLRKHLWKDDEWVQDDPALNFILNIREGEQCRVESTDYGKMGSKMLYMFYAHGNRCTYSCEGTLVDLGKDYKYLLGYYPKKLFYTKFYE